jgi:hypothetical protein
MVEPTSQHTRHILRTTRFRAPARENHSAPGPEHPEHTRSGQTTVCIAGKERNDDGAAQSVHNAVELQEFQLPESAPQIRTG